MTLSVPRSEQFSESAAVSFEKLIMSKEKYPRIFWCQMHAGYCVCYPSNIFRKKVLGYSPILVEGIFGHAMCLNKSCPKFGKFLNPYPI